MTLVGLIMGSRSDWGVMAHAARTLRDMGVPYETKVVSAHRTPDLMREYALSAERRGLRVIIAGAGGKAAHLPGMVASWTVLPVFGVPVTEDALGSIVGMPIGVPVGTLSAGVGGAINAALLTAALLAHDSPSVRDALLAYRAEKAGKVLDCAPLVLLEDIPSPPPGAEG